MIDRLNEDFVICEPPDEWYFALAREDRGIIAILFQDRLTGLGNGQVGRLLREWGHYTGNPECKRDSKERRIRAVEVMRIADEVIPKFTGFSPAQIWEKADFLKRTYGYTQNAPIEICR